MAVRVRNNLNQPLMLPRPLNIRLEKRETRDVDYVEHDEVINDRDIAALIASGALTVNDLDAVTTHASTHEVGGSDELDVTGLQGVLATPQTPIVPAQTVRVAKTGGDFTSVKAAVDSITDASVLKPYVVIVHPGIYQEDPFLMKSYVTVQAVPFARAVVLQTTDPNAHFIQAAPASALVGISLYGPNSAGFACINHDTNNPIPFVMSQVTIQRGNIGIRLAPPASTAVVIATLCGYEEVGASVGTWCSVSGFGFASIAIARITTAVPGAITTGVSVVGANAEVFITNANIGAPLMADCLFMDAGASVKMSACVFSAGVNAMHIGSTAGGSSLRAFSVDTTTAVGITNDLLVDAADADILLNGQIDKNKLSVNPAATLAATFLDETVGESGVVTLGELWLGTQAESIPLSTYTRNTAPTGSVSGGGGLSRVSGLTVNIAAGTGFVNTGTGVVYVTWTSTNLGIAANTNTEIVVDANGTISAQSSPDLTNYIVLGTAETNATDVVFLAGRTVLIDQHHLGNHVYANDVVGPISVSGTAAAKAGSPSLQLNVDAGEYYIYDVRKTATANAPITFTYWYRDGSGGWNYVTGSTAIDPDFYDDGSGTLAALGVGEFKRDLLFVAVNSGSTDYHVVYGQETFVSQVAAESGNNPAAPAVLLDNSLRIAAIIVEDGATDIASISDQRPKIGQSAVGVTAVTDHGLLSGLLDDDHTQYQLRSEEGVANGYAGLDGSALVPAAQLNLSATLPVDVDPTAPSAGVSDEIARADHRHQLVVPDRTVTVAPTGGQHTTLAAGLAAAVALTPTVSNPVGVLVYPGAYVEANPLTIPTGVSVIGVGGINATIIQPTTTTSPILIGSASSQVSSLTLEGASGAGGIGWRADGALASAVGVVASNCETGFASASFAVLDNCRAVPGAGSMTTGFYASGGSTLIAHLSRAVGASGNLITRGWHTETGGIMRTQACAALFCVDGIRIDGTDTHIHTGQQINTNTNGIVIPGGSTNARVQFTGVIITNSTTFDIDVSSATATFSLVGTFTQSKTNFNTSSQISVAAHSESAGDESFDVLGTLSVGSQDFPSHTFMGQGRPSVIDMAVLSNSNGEAGVWVDNTATAVSASGSTFSLFQGTGVNQAAYFGRDEPFGGVKVDVVTALIIGAGVVEAEYWNGATWASLPFMVTDADSSYAQYARLAFQRANLEHIHFGSTTSWATRTLNGITKYWVRFRITTAITTIPILESVRINNDTTVVHDDGFLTYLGAARPSLPRVWHRNLLDDISGSSPVTATINISTNIVLNALSARFADNAIDARGALIQIPTGIDTSFPLTLQVFWYATANTGNLELQIDYAFRTLGQVFDGTAPQTTLSQIIAVPGTSLTLVQTDFTIPILDRVPGDFLAIRIFRDATGGNADDTLAGDAVLVATSIVGTSWR